MKINTYLIQIADTSLAGIVVQVDRWLLVWLHAHRSLSMVGAEKEDSAPLLRHVRDCRVGLGECKEGGEYLSLPQLQELRRDFGLFLRMVPTSAFFLLSISSASQKEVKKLSQVIVFRCCPSISSSMTLCPLFTTLGDLASLPVYTCILQA